MDTEAALRADCAVARTLEQVGERWTLLVLREAFLGTRRFDAMQRNIGCARNILADRLHKLVAAEIFRRERYQERPDRHEYRLTEKGLDLWPVLVTLMAWGERHGGSVDGPVVAIRHTACGAMIDPVLRCPVCNEELDARAVRAVPGPAALARTA
jgi:DNA-binding HxlR family transcriptional regulator